MSLADKLDGKKVLVTGVTGFVGEALLHRIIGDLPGTTVVAIIRPKGSLTGADRMAQMLKKDIFKPFYGEGTEHAAAEADPQADLNASVEYRVHLAKVLTRRALEAASA